MSLDLCTICYLHEISAKNKHKSDACYYCEHISKPRPGEIDEPADDKIICRYFDSGFIGVEFKLEDEINFSALESRSQAIKNYLLLRNRAEVTPEFQPHPA